MTLRAKDLSVLAFANGFTLWHYRSTDAPVHDRVCDAGSDLLRAGDMILATGDDGAEAGAALLLVAPGRPGELRTRSLLHAAAPTSDAATDDADARRYGWRLLRLAERKEQLAQQLRNADNTARGEQDAGEALADATALRWVVGRLGDGAGSDSAETPG